MLAHIAFYTERMDKSIDFYKSLFGFRKAFTLYKDDGKPWIEYLIDSNGAFIEFFYAEILNQDKQGSGSFSHFCLEVDDIEDVINRSITLGIPLHKPLKLGLDHSWQCWFIDPNGVQVEVMQMTEQSLQAKLRKELVQESS